MNAIARFFQKPIFQNKRFIMTIWFALPLIAALKHIFREIGNNYLIFKYSFYHLIEQTNLYIQYPDQYFDTNHYGPFFSVIIGPFALLPDNAGSLLWELFIAATLFYAIYKLPIKWIGKVIIYWITFDSVFSNAANSQTNAMIAALIIGAFICIRSGKDFWGTLFIAIGFFIKLYGIVGLAFFFFSKSKPKFIGYFLFWCVVCFVLPMAFSSPEFVVQSYIDWYHSLLEKDVSNSDSMMQNISAIGMIYKIFKCYTISNFWILIPAVLLFAIQYLQIGMYKDLRYQLGILASTLTFVVLFSTGSESCTYIIATVGFGIWFIMQEKPLSKYAIFMLVFMLVMTILASSDLSPTYVKKQIVRPYALKALPFLMMWLTLIYQLLTMKKPKKGMGLSDVYLEEDKKEKE